jgi:hypothetical protein
VAGRRPAASAALAGVYLMAALVCFVGGGLLLGWLAGQAAAGAVAGGVIGVPVSFYLVYREYRDI